MEREDNITSNHQKTKILWIVLMIAFIVIMILMVVIIRLMKQPEPIETPVGEVRATVITEDNVKEVVSQAEASVEAGYYTCKMNVEWHFKDATKPSDDAYVANPTINTHTVYFDVNLEDGNELVYSSPYIPVGGEIREIQLEKILEAGTYPAVVTYHLVDENENELSTVSVTVTLFVEN